MSVMGMLGDGHVWTDARVLLADIEVDEAEARALLPPSLDLPAPAIATVFVADYPQTAFGSVYREAAVLLHAADEAGPLLHCPWMVVDDDTALILGREALGFPKKMAEIELELDGPRAVGTVRRRGAEVLRIECDAETVETDPIPVFARRFVNACGTMVHGLDLLEIPAAGEDIHESRRGPAKVLLASSEREALGRLATAVDTEARVVHLDFGGGAGATNVLRPADAEWAASRLLSRLL